MITENLLYNYMKIENSYDEYFLSPTQLHKYIEPILSRLHYFSKNNIIELQKEAKKIFRQRGVTFQVYSHKEENENIFPFDVIPRIISANEWAHLERGLLQRITALNHFLADIYNEQEILKAGVIPSELILSSKGLVPQAKGIRPPENVYIHVAGIDLVRNPKGEFLILEDNLRNPSGISYVLENRQIMQDLFPHLFMGSVVHPISLYPGKLRSSLTSLTKKHDSKTCSVLLTPGPYNSAYFEHVFLAKQMGYELVTAEDLFTEQGYLYLKTCSGPRVVDVVYRRIDDDFLDPLVFRKDSLIGIPGIYEVYAKGNVVLANAVGNSIADDKGVYPYVPSMIKFYLSEDPILNQVETYNCFFDKEREHVVQNLESLVIKNVDGYGGFDLFFGSQSTKAERMDAIEKITKNPRRYIAQPIVELSTCPTFEDDKVVPKRVDFRPYIVSGKTSWVAPGGLTRVALKKDGYVVNSCQGGGSKDTWILQN